MGVSGANPRAKAHRWSPGAARIGRLMESLVKEKTDSSGRPSERQRVLHVIGGGALDDFQALGLMRPRRLRSYCINDCSTVQKDIRANGTAKRREPTNVGQRISSVFQWSQ
jgi:hypothetical protein